MKIFKVALIAIAIFIGANVSAQNSPITFGVKAGINLSNFYGNGVENLDLKAKPGFNVGVTMDYAFTPAMYLMTGLELTTKGAKWSTREDGETLKVTSNPMYLQLPVHFGYKIDIAPGTRFVLHAGPYVAYGVGGKDTITYNGGKRSFNIFGKDNAAKAMGIEGVEAERFDYGVGLGVGVEFGQINVGLGYDLGLGNLSGVKEAKQQNMNAYLSVGYRF
ncbi:MAG: PorT family protein [Dysgonamonadaceae bacterium]|jgi:hypothetical protein|nr:PorT family protein [Dysgonamonadaceae bacterium]